MSPIPAPDHPDLTPDPDPVGVEQTFDALVSTHYAPLCTFAFRLLGTRDAAEDAVQEVLFKVWTRQDPANLRDQVPYLYQAVRNQCFMVLRHDRRWDETGIESGALLPASTQQDAEVFDLRDALAQGIAALPERTRLVFSMHREQDLTYNEIARVLGISVKTVEAQMSRALRILRRRLAKYLCLAAAALPASDHWAHLLR